MDRQLEVYRHPAPAAGHAYTSTVTLTPPATVSPLTMLGAAVAVAALLS